MNKLNLFPLELEEAFRRFLRSDKVENKADIEARQQALLRIPLKRQKEIEKQIMEVFEQENLRNIHEGWIKMMIQNIFETPQDMPLTEEQAMARLYAEAVKHNIPIALVHEMIKDHLRK